MTANEKRQQVVDLYKTIIGRNKYSQSLRDYCYKKYKDGKYYSDCSSSISYTYKEAGYGFGILNTVGMYQSTKFTSVPVIIKNGQIQNPDVLRVGDMFLFAGTDSGRAYANYVGHVEFIAKISGASVTLYGHGSGTPSSKDMKTYCKNRFNAKTSTKLGNQGLIRVVRFIQDDDGTVDVPAQDVSDSNVKVTGNTVNIRFGAGTSYASGGIASLGAKFQRPKTDGWKPIQFEGKVRWMSDKYLDAAGVCTGASVNVRSGPGTTYPVVGMVRKGARLEVVKTAGWVPIVWNNDVFWISEKYVG